MNIDDNPNLEMVYTVAKSLEDLLEEVVFVGGCATALLLTDPAISATRPTNDVDVIIEVLTQKDFHKFESRLKILGYANDTNGPMCRFKLGSVLVDFMPINDNILGYSNIWYQLAVDTASTVPLAELNIRVITPPLFIAAKLVAFKARGKNDYFASHDLEDIIAILDGRNEIVADMFDSPLSVLEYIKGELSALINVQSFMDAIPGHIERLDSATRTEELVNRIDRILKIKEQPGNHIGN